MRIRAVAVLALAAALPSLAAAAGDSNKQSAIVAGEIAAIAKQLGLRPETAIDLTEVSGEYCFNVGLDRGGHMTHYAVDPGSRTEDVIDFINAEPLAAAGIPVDKLPAFPGGLDTMQPNQWYYLATGAHEPHHGRSFPFPLLLRATSLD